MHRTVREAKSARTLTFADVAAEVGRSEVSTTAAILGQARRDPAEAEALVALLGFGPNVAAALQAHPMKGSLDAPVPVDPLIEVTQVHGTTIKALIHEKYGERIMSSIDFKLSIDRSRTPRATG